MATVEVSAGPIEYTDTGGNGRVLVLLHGLLGVRAVLLDFGLPVRWHRVLFAGAIALGVVLFGVVWGLRWY